MQPTVSAEHRTEPGTAARHDQPARRRRTNGTAGTQTDGAPDTEESTPLASRSSSIERSLKALASRRRLQILEWLKDPSAHFPPQQHGDPIEHGACNMYITDKLGVSQPAASRHMKVLVDAGLVIATPRAGYVYYRRDEQAIDRLTSELATI